LMLVGCGGGAGSTGVTQPPTNPGGSNSTPNDVSATFHVDLKSGKVNVIQKQASSRSVYSGDAIQFVTSNEVDVVGNPGYRQLKVAIKNQTGVPIGVDPDGKTGGLQCVIGSITNLGGPSDPRTTTLVSTVSGSGALGDTTGSPDVAQLRAPEGVAVTPDGTIYISDSGNNRIKSLKNGVVSNFVGSGVAANVAGIGLAAKIKGPSAMAVDPADNALVFVEPSSNVIVRTQSDGYTSVIAGNGAAGSANGNGGVATFNTPQGIVAVGNGTFLVCDYLSHKIRQLTYNAGDRRSSPSWQVTTVAGGGSAATTDGQGAGAFFNFPVAIAK
ncbi:MAG: hypothetical protein ABUL72_02405, partial [Armatimonadota bacterium]